MGAVLNETERRSNVLEKDKESTSAASAAPAQGTSAASTERVAASRTDKQVKAPVYIPQTTLPVLQGHLSKKSTGQKRWSFANAFRKDVGYGKRFFMLRDMQLLWWDTEEDAGAEDAVRPDGGTKCK